RRPDQRHVGGPRPSPRRGRGAARGGGRVLPHRGRAAPHRPVPRRLPGAPRRGRPARRRRAGRRGDGAHRGGARGRVRCPAGVGPRGPDARLRQEHVALAAPPAPHGGARRAGLPAAHGAVAQGLRGRDARPARGRAARGHARRDGGRGVARRARVPGARRRGDPPRARPRRRGPGRGRARGRGPGPRVTTSLAAASRARLARPTTWPWWTQVLAVYALARGVSAGILLVVARAQEANLWTDAAPSYTAYVARMWDASWYEQIYASGYPDTLPVGADGAVQQNVWAFFPLFPALVRALDAVTGLGWDVLAPTVALVCGAGAALVIHRLVATAGAAAVAQRPGLPLATVLLVSVFPSSPVLQVAYTESLALLLVAAALLLLARHRYGWAALVIVLLGLSRAVALPMAAVVVWHGVVRWRRGGLAAADAARLGALLVASL